MIKKHINSHYLPVQLFYICPVTNELGNIMLNKRSEILELFEDLFESDDMFIAIIWR